ncbi:MAG: hypothetical protein Nkreftii_003050 [Candidatus Nitrospira kreftii]|uniref:Uncharacterized protein n=1 Tax=Candidatus Nitrospira kreftii TaxID=2652173 RepID=A0A7S8FGC0_9BACT|nr:MAG: hypothetical protein Nkreftii_003050 [Candidatus Nitrospira kreftii]
MKNHNVLEETNAVQMDTCGRCQGLMVPCYTDSLFLELTEAVRTPSWRCVNCGEWIDTTIASNRQRTRHESAPSTEPASASPNRRWSR